MRARAAALVLLAGLVGGYNPAAQALDFHDFYFSGAAGIAVGSTISGGSVGSVLYVDSSGLLGQTQKININTSLDEVNIGSSTTRANPLLRLYGWNSTSSLVNAGRLEVHYYTGVAGNNVVLGASNADQTNIRLQVDSNTAHIGFNIGGAQNSDVTIQNDAAGGNPYIGIRGPQYKTGTDVTQLATLKMTRDNLEIATVKGPIILQPVAGSNVNVGTTSATATLYVSSMISVGVPLPTHALDLYAAATPGPVVYFRNVNSGLTDSDGGYVGYLGTGNADLYLWNIEARPTRIGTSNTQRGVILATGEFGWGSTNPQTKMVLSSGVFTIDGTSSGLDLAQNNTSLRVKDSGGTLRQVLKIDAADTVQIGDVAGGYNLQMNAGTSTMTFTAGGLLKQMTFTSTEVDAKTAPSLNGDGGVGYQLFNRTLAMICISTGTGAGAFVRGTSAAAGGTACR